MTNNVKGKKIKQKRNGSTQKVKNIHTYPSIHAQMN